MESLIDHTHPLRPLVASGLIDLNKLYTGCEFFEILKKLTYTNILKLATRSNNQLIILKKNHYHARTIYHYLSDILYAFFICMNYTYKVQPTSKILDVLLLCMSPIRFEVLDLVIEKARITNDTYYSCEHHSEKDIPKLISYLMSKDKYKAYVCYGYFKCIDNCLQNQSIQPTRYQIDYNKNYRILLTLFQNGHKLSDLYMSYYQNITRLTKQRLLNNGISPHQLNMFNTFKHRKMKMKHTLRILKSILICDIIEYVVCNYIMHDRYIAHNLSRHQLRKMRKINERITNMKIIHSKWNKRVMDSDSD